MTEHHQSKPTSSDQPFIPPRSGTYPTGGKEPTEAGVDYPRTYAEFNEMFPDEDACLQLLYDLKWPAGHECPRCGGGADAPRSGRLVVCPDCSRLSAVTAGTIFHGSEKQVRSWLKAIWWSTNQEFGFSAEQLQKQLGLEDYGATWVCLEKLRQAMASSVREPLRGSVQVAKTFVEVLTTAENKRQTARKVVVAIAHERCSDHSGRVRLRSLSIVTPRVMLEFVADVIHQGSEVLTSKWQGYGKLDDLGFEHETPELGDDKDEANAELSEAQKVAGLLRLWLWGTLNVTHEQLPHFLDEFTFRFNNRSASPGLLFHRLLCLAIGVAPDTRRPRHDNEHLEEQSVAG